MALFKAVLCAWGEIVGEVVFRVQHPVASTQGPVIYSMQSLAYDLPIGGLWTVSAPARTWRIASGEQCLRHYCGKRIIIS